MIVTYQRISIFISLIVILSGPALLSDVAIPSIYAESAIEKFILIGDHDFGALRGVAYYILISVTVLKATLATLIVFLLSIVIGFVVSVLFPNSTSAVDALVSSFRSVPTIAWLPLLVFAGGWGDWHGELYFTCLGIFPMMMAQILYAFRHCSEEKLVVGRLSTGSQWKVFVAIMFPNALGAFTQAIRYGFGLAIILSLVYGYFFESITGISQILNPLQSNITAWDAVVFLILVACVGFVTDRAIMLGKDVVEQMWVRRAKTSAAL